MTYSLDFRKWVLAIQKQENLNNRATSERFGINTRTLYRWKQCLKPKQKRAKKATKINMEALALDVERYPDAYNHERAERLGVSKSCVFYALKRLGISNKKNTNSSQSK